MYTCGIRINANLVKEGSFRINAKLVKEELNQKNTKSIERVQRTMTRYICGYSKAEYNERLLHLHLAPLSLRRDQNDVIFFWKCLHPCYDLDLTKFVSFSHDNPRQNRSSTESIRLNPPMF